MPIAETGTAVPLTSYSKGLKLCSAQFCLLFSARFACSCSPIPLQHSRLMVNNGRLPIRKIGSGSITILTCTIRTIITLPNTIRADRTCIIVIRQRCRCPLTTRIGLIFIQRNVVTTPVVISGSIFSRMCFRQNKNVSMVSVWMSCALYPAEPVELCPRSKTSPLTSSTLSPENTSKEQVKRKMGKIGDMMYSKRETFPRKNAGNHSIRFQSGNLLADWLKNRSWACCYLLTFVLELRQSSVWE